MPDRLIEEIKRKKVSVEEMVSWEDSKPPIRFSGTGDHVSFEANLCFSVYKLTGILGGLSAVLWSAIKYGPAIYGFLLSLK